VEGHDIRGGVGRLIDDVIAAVDVERFAGDQARYILGEECGVVDADEALPQDGVPYRCNPPLCVGATDFGMKK
jgi:hypothetical protein